MSGQKGKKGTHHKPYKGPWPEEHNPSVPGRDGKDEKLKEKTHPQGGSGAPQGHKIPPPAPK